ncbi:Ger(x)C family spore germination protein [Paenibacillus lutimineralis]|uniref:Ger(X)C family spore germination protein n=1 Tax=Paenibacillus lutimineralis TaxID=2707005 RepID=A0A3S9UYB8_9BACL|nr:Ger(x)C family spore germination protein [Paenibacillus lutimineralis]AZS15308.1 Ger(x)C family spore germination protein [Paenibacillus lutimineralis]
MRAVRRKLLLLAGVIPMLLLLLTSCWNSKDIQNMAYITAIGFDYENGKYVTYVQVLNFSNVAKSESNQSGRSVPTWIGKGEGTSVTQSFNSIYSTAQLRVFWGHVKALVFSERFLEEGERIRSTYDLVNRYREIRYNIPVYGTREPLRDILAMKSNLNLSPLQTVMESPEMSYSQRSDILPLHGYKLIALINEPAGAPLLPSLAIDREAWTEDTDPKSMFKIDGAYFFKGTVAKDWFSEDDLKGYRWMQKKLQRSIINIPNDIEPEAAIVIENPSNSVHHTVRDGHVYFTINLKLNAYVDELRRNLKKQEIEKMASQTIENQIRHTFMKGMARKVDIFNLTECLYRENPKKWRELNSEGGFMIDKESLVNVKVDVRLQHSGKYKLRVD